MKYVYPEFMIFRLNTFMFGLINTFISRHARVKNYNLNLIFDFIPG